MSFAQADAISWAVSPPGRNGRRPDERKPTAATRRWGLPRWVRSLSLRTTVGFVVTAIWGASYTITIFNPSYQPSPAITSVMLVVIGYLFLSTPRG